MKNLPFKESVLTIALLSTIFSVAFFAKPVFAQAFTCPQPYATGATSNGVTQCVDQGNQSIINFSDSTGQPVTTGVGSVTPTGTQTNANGQVADSCSLFGGSWFENCIWFPLMSWLGSWFLTIGGAILVFAGVIFDWLVQGVIINFAGTLNSMGASTAINTGWSIFRDLSNIVIIGMFTFIAIATILGNTEYGYKKMLSRVLIVAVLINFSLLFTKIIIDAGNFTAYQIYKQTAPAQQSGSTGQTFDIAGAFMKPMGITSVWDTQGVLTKIAQTTNSGLQAFAFGLVGGLMLFALAVVLLYGCFLIASRAILLIILMLTASIAFASHLIPKFSSGEYGWSGWWKSLINASLFAPLLMIFLYISLLILNGAQAVTQGAGGNSVTEGATVFGALTQPGQAVSGTGWTVIMLYIFGIGLLFASLKLSSSFASSIGGFNWATAVTGAPLSLGSQFAGFFGRQTLGRLGARREEDIKRQRDDAKRRGDDGAATRLNLSLDRSKRFGVASLGSRDFNAMNTSAGKTFAKAAGLPGFLSGASKVGGFKKQAETAAKEGEKVAKEVVLSSDDKKAIQSQAEKGYKESQGETRKQAEQLHETAKESLKVTRETAAQNKTQFEQEKQNAQKILDAHKDSSKKADEAFDKQLQGLAEELKRSTGTPDATRVEASKRAVEARRDIEMKEQAQNIERAKSEVDRIQGRIVAEDTNISRRAAEVNKAESVVADLDRAAEDHGKKTVDKAEERFLNAAGNQAASYAQRRLSNLPYALSSGDDFVAREARRVFKKGQKDKGLKERLAAWRQLDKEEGGTEEKSADSAAEKH